MMRKTCWFVAAILGSHAALNGIHAASVSGELNVEGHPAVAATTSQSFLRAGDIIMTSVSGEDSCSGPNAGDNVRCVQLPYSYSTGDLGIRFNKFEFTGENSQPPDHWARLTLDDYPIQGNNAQVLKQETTAGSVVTEEDYQFLNDCRLTAHEYIMASGGYPTMPNSDPNNAFWEEFEEVVDWQVARRRNVNANTVFRLPDLWNEMNISQVAEAVHDEYP